MSGHIQQTESAPGRAHRLGEQSREAVSQRMNGCGRAARSVRQANHCLPVLSLELLIEPRRSFPREFGKVILSSIVISTEFMQVFPPSSGGKLFCRSLFDHNAYCTQPGPESWKDSESSCQYTFVQTSRRYCTGAPQSLYVLFLFLRSHLYASRRRLHSLCRYVTQCTVQPRSAETNSSAA